MIVHPLKRSLFIPGRGTEVFFKGGGSHGFQWNEGRIRCRQKSIKGTKARVEEERKFG